MHVDDLDISPSKIAETSQRIVDRALEDARRREHPLLTNEHLFLAFTQVEWDIFAEVMRDVRLNPHTILQAIEEHLQLVPAAPGRELCVSPSTKIALKMALHQASRSGRQSIEAADLLAAVLEETQGVPVSILRRHGVEPSAVVTRLSTRVRDLELRDERLRKRFELPPFLKHFATNLNLLARQDRLPVVHGSDQEIQQVMEILCHRERANSVMLVGEPGVGKTAIVEGLARRIEFEPETVPVRLRDCQVVNLQMNAMVAGTMLRGMFEDRIQNVIKEIKERPNLILFVDEAHTIIGAGSALGAPSDAANVLKSVLARGEVRMIAATTLSEYKEYIQDDEAFARRFRTVDVPEPSIAETRRMLDHLRPRLERSYSVRLRDDAIETALELSPRYMRHLHLPDKVIGWLDTAAVRAEIDRRWEVGGNDVVSVVSHAAGIPEDMVCRDVAERFTSIDARLEQRVVGQKEAVRAVARRLVLNKGPLKDGFDRPDGVLLFLGSDRRGQDRAGEGRGRVPVRRREEDDPRGHVRVPGRHGGGRQADWDAARHRRQRAGRHSDQPAARPPVQRRAARRDREGESEPAEPVPAGVRRGVAHRRPRAARLSQRCGGHHDVEHRVGELPQAHQPARFPVEKRRPRAGEGRSHAGGRTPPFAGVQEPHRPGGALLAAVAGRSAGDCAAISGEAGRDPRRARARRSRWTKPHWTCSRSSGYSLAYRGPVPEARHRRAGQVARSASAGSRAIASRFGVWE